MGPLFSDVNTSRTRSTMPNGSPQWAVALQRRKFDGAWRALPDRLRDVGRLGCGCGVTSRAVLFVPVTRVRGLSVPETRVDRRSVNDSGRP